MATPKQIDFILALYEELGQVPEDDVYELNTWEASDRIKELLEIKNGMEG